MSAALPKGPSNVAKLAVLNSGNCQLIASSAGFSQNLQGTDTTVRVQLKPNEYAVFATLNTAGVDDIIADDATGATVSGGIGEIIINGSYRHVTVHNLQGVAQGSLRVAPGLYLVNVDGHTTKVLVK